MKAWKIAVLAAATFVLVGFLQAILGLFLPGIVATFGGIGLAAWMGREMWRASLGAWVRS